MNPLTNYVIELSHNYMSCRYCYHFRQYFYRNGSILVDSLKLYENYRRFGNNDTH